MKDLQENIVPATEQNAANFYVHTPNAKGKRFLFVGNSITKHGIKPSIGWTRDCGMAASAPGKDYVHLLELKILQKIPDACFAILQVAEYERTFLQQTPAQLYAAAPQVKSYAPDVAIFFFGANVPKEYDTMEHPEKSFGQAWEDLRRYLDTGHTTFLHAQGFYIRPVLDAEKAQIAEKYREPLIPMEDIRIREDTHGLFNHPNDFGMQCIADRFYTYLEPILGV